MAIRLPRRWCHGNVGREKMLNILDERPSFQWMRSWLWQLPKSLGTEISFARQDPQNQDRTPSISPAGTSAVFAVGQRRTKILCAPKAAAAGCVVIDNSSTSLIAMNPDVPSLIVPEVNADAIFGLYQAKKLIANAETARSCAEVGVLKPLHDLSRIKAVFVSTLPIRNRCAAKTASTSCLGQTQKASSIPR